MNNLFSIQISYDFYIVFWNFYNRLFISKKKMLNEIKNLSIDFFLHHLIFLKKINSKMVDIIFLPSVAFILEQLDENKKIKFSK